MSSFELGDSSYFSSRVFVRPVAHREWQKKFARQATRRPLGVEDAQVRKERLLLLRKEIFRGRRVWCRCRAAKVQEEKRQCTWKVMHCSVRLLFVNTLGKEGNRPNPKYIHGVY